MKLPDALQSLLHQKVEEQEMFLSLLLDVDYVQGAVWHGEPGGKTEIESTTTESVGAPSWEERIIAADHAISKLEESTPGTRLQKVVLGLPANYLTDDGEIKPEVRPEIKKLTKELDLTAIGFVAVHQALVHKLKLDEGVPPSVILISVGANGLTVSLYKVGGLLGVRPIDRDNIVSDLEAILKSFKDLEVLPSRILLYGIHEKELEEVRLKLMKHPWPTRANFLHFPKIDILPAESGIIAVSLAGASETSKTLGEEAEVEAGSAQGVPQSEVKTQEAAAPPEESNVEEVQPETLGFKKSQDILETPDTSSGFAKEEAVESEVETEPGEPEGKAGFALPPITLPSFKLTPLVLGLKALSFRGIPIPLLGLVILLLLFFAATYWILPHATVTILAIPKPLDEQTILTIDPTATVTDSNSKIIPGKKQEQEVSGEKVLPVTGKKQVGDPAKGAVTIYNKDTTSSKTFPKGSILTASSLKFTLDSEVQVASASQTSIDTITFGKATAKITASAIGTQSNLPAGTQFDFQDYATSIAIARNDQALSGGTSRDITIVSRADYDALVKALTDELVQKAQTNLGSSVTGHEKLIADTVETTVSQKTFTEELDQEAKELHGKVTLTVSGISYNEDDVTNLMKGILDGKLPTSYSLAPSDTKITVKSSQVKKDGTVVATIQFHAVALPTLDTRALRSALAGKSLRSAQDYLRTVTGVGGVEFSFRWTPLKDRLPTNKNNISITVAIQE